MRKHSELGNCFPQDHGWEEAHTEARPWKAGKGSRRNEIQRPPTGDGQPVVEDRSRSTITLSTGRPRLTSSNTCMKNLSWEGKIDTFGIKADCKRQTLSNHIRPLSITDPNSRQQGPCTPDLKPGEKSLHKWREKPKAGHTREWKWLLLF